LAFACSNMGCNAVKRESLCLGTEEAELGASLATARHGGRVGVLLLAVGDMSAMLITR